MKQILLTISIAIAFSLASCNNSGNNPVTVTSLLKEMTNRDNLAKLSSPEFKMLQASSYSRKSVSPDKEGWFDNDDASQFVRVDTIDGRIEHVLMDADGPGAIVRYWSTWHAQRFSMGTLRFYFDNAKTPQLEGRIDEIMSSNKFVGKPLSQTAAPFLENNGWFSGHNLYFPFPYATHCKVTYQKADEKINDVLYYQINYRQYAKGTKVETYKKGDLENGKYADILKRTSNELLNSKVSKGKATNLKGIIKPNESLSTTIDGMQAINKLTVKINADDLEQALRSTVITMEFDGKETVWVPIGDFFGTGYKIAPYQTYFSNVKCNGEMTCLFPMPFKKNAKISIHNFGKQNVDLQKLEVYTDAWQWNEKSLYFHANWRNYWNISTAEKRDVNYITIKGKGKYVADALTFFNNGHYWWGEGDEKIYVDGESFPSHFGTGTEDYYGYAWCSVVDFSAPFNAQPLGDGNRSPGLTVNSRFRALDVIPFNKSLKFDIEIWHWEKTQIDYAPTTFWYGTYKSVAEYKPAIEDVQHPVNLVKRFEGESFDVEKLSDGEVITQAYLSHDWSAQNHLLWRGMKKDDKLKLVFSSVKQQNGNLKMVFTIAPNYPKVDVYLNGKMIFKNLNLYSEKLSRKEFSTKDITLNKGKNNISFVIKGTNKSERNELGFDYLEVE